MENHDSDLLPQTIRLNRFLASAGISSRRKAEEFIRSGAVSVNGSVVRDLATRVHPDNDRVTLYGERIRLHTEQIYLVLNKPNDYITTASDERGRKTVFDLVPSTNRLFPIGRLDRKTTGVLLFTNDGDLAHRLMHPSYSVEKSYFITLATAITGGDLQKLRDGIHLEDGKTAPATVRTVSGTKGTNVIITIHEGKNRQVRRMFESLGYEVKKLDRISYGPITLTGLRRGQWRYLQPNEVRKLRRLTSGEAE